MSCAGFERIQEMGSGLGEKDTDDEKRRIGRTESAARAFCGKTDTVAYGSEEEKKDGKRDYTRSL